MGPPILPRPRPPPLGGPVPSPLGIVFTSSLSVPPTSLAAAVTGLKSPTPPSAARHQEHVLVQLPADEGCQHSLDVTADLRDDLDARCRNDPFQRPRDRATDQHRCPMLDKEVRPGLRLLRVHGDVLACLFLAVGNIDEQQVARHVENRTDPSLPVRYRDSHHPYTGQITGQRRGECRKSLQIKNIGDGAARRSKLIIEHFELTVAARKS